MMRICARSRRKAGVIQINTVYVKAEKRDPAAADALNALEAKYPESRALSASEHAAFLAERRAFDPGHDVDDWLEAEQLIDQTLAGKGPKDRPN